MRRPRFVAVVVMAGCLAACAAPATNPGGTAAASVAPAPAPPKPRFTQEGLASWYGRGWNGRKTASGETFDMHAMTAAHRSLPLGTVVRVTNLENGRSAKVRINDRGPNVADDPRRILDLSAHAASRLGMIEDGVTRVKVEALDADQEADKLDRTSD